MVGRLRSRVPERSGVRRRRRMLLLRTGREENLRLCESHRVSYMRLIMPFPKLNALSLLTSNNPIPVSHPTLTLTTSFRTRPAKGARTAPRALPFDPRTDSLEVAQSPPRPHYPSMLYNERARLYSEFFSRICLATRSHISVTFSDCLSEMLRARRLQRMS